MEDKDVKFLFLFYLPENLVPAVEENTPIGEKWKEAGVYFGTYTMDGTQYHVFANYIIGE